MHRHPDASRHCVPPYDVNFLLRFRSSIFIRESKPVAELLDVGALRAARRAPKHSRRGDPCRIEI
jgi:hypothetical protein